MSTKMITVPGSPFGVAATPDGRYAFAASSSSLAVIALTKWPAVLHTVALPATVAGAAGATVTPDGRLLLVAAGSGIVVVSVAAAERTPATSVLGTLGDGTGTDAIEVTSSPDGRYAFVSREYANEVDVFDLAAVRSGHFRTSGPVGHVTVGRTVVGSALSTDGSKLYVTSEGGGPDGGLLSVLDVHQLETRPSTAVVTSVPAGCDPVRVQPSPDGRTVWVTARESNEVLAFDAADLTTDPRHALRASVRVGPAPVGLAFFKGGRRLLVTQSNRFTASAAAGSLVVVDPAAALAREPAVLGVIPAGRFPRDAVYNRAADTILVSNYGSNEVQDIDAATVP